MGNRHRAAFAAAFLGIFLIGILGFKVWHGMGSSYETVETLSGQEKGAGLVGEVPEAPEGEGASAGGAASAEASQGESADVSETPAGETALPSEESPVPEPVTLVFAGDVLLSDHVLNAYETGGGITGVVGQGFLDEMQGADLFVVNEEFPFSSRGEAAPDKQYTFRLPPERVSIFKEMGIDLVTLANNHALDFGTDALVDTLDTLDQAGILHVGAGRNLDKAKEPVIAELKGMKIGFIGASRVIPETSWNATSTKPGMLVTYDPALTVQEIEKLDEVCDYVVVYVHWGIERAEHPEEYQRTMGRQYIDAGADLVVGSHPHVLQGIEYYEGKPIVYSLGNFVFGSSIPRTALLKVVLEREETEELRAGLQLLPGASGAGYTRPLTEEGERAEFYSYMMGISYGVNVDGEGKVLTQQ